MPEQSGIYFKEEGNGFPVLLIHGFCETHEIWNSFSKKLSDEYKVLSVDLPGFGKSPLPQTPFSIENAAEIILTLLHTLQIRQCIVIGHSLGGYVMLAMMNLQPHLFKGACLFHSTAYPDSDEKKISKNKVIEFVTNNGVATFIKSFVPPLFFNQKNDSIPEVVNLALRTKLETLVAYAGAMRDRPDRTDTIRKFDSPILFISGEKDGVVSPESMQKQAEMAINATLHILPEVGHMGMFENEPVVLKQVKTFLMTASS